MSKKVSLIFNIAILALVAICVITMLLPCFSVKVSSLDEELWNTSAYTSGAEEPQKVRFGVGFLVNTVLNFGDVSKCLVREEGASTPSLGEMKEMWEKLEDNKGFANAVMGVFVIINALAKGGLAWIALLLIFAFIYALAGIILLVHLIKSVIFLVKEKEGVTVKRMSGKFEAAPLICLLLAVVPLLNCLRLLNPQYYGGLDVSASVWSILCFVSAFAICSVRVAAEVIGTEDSVAKGELLKKQLLSLASVACSMLCLIMIFPIAAKQTTFVNAIICLINVFVIESCIENVIARYGMFVRNKDYTERKASHIGGVLLAIIGVVGCIVNSFNVFSIIGLIGAIVFVVLEFYYHSKYDVTVQAK